MTVTIECQPIALARSREDFQPAVALSNKKLLQLEQLQLSVMRDYYASFRRNNSTSHTVTAKAYLLGNAEEWPDNSILCPEMPLPGHVTPSVRLIVPRASSWTKRAVALIHAGREGCIAPVHFDWDHTWVAHVCLMGKKRFFFFPPQSSWLLNPIVNTSAFCVPRFSKSDRDEILSRLGGEEVVVEAGEGILFPSMFWHGLLYEEPSLGLSVRFEPRPGGRPFAALPRSWLLQRLVWRFFKQGYGPESDEFLVRYLKSFFHRTRTWKQRYRRIVDVCRSALLSYGENQGALELVSESFSAEMALAEPELRHFYGNTVAIQPHENDSLREAHEYIFESVECPSAAQDLRLAGYALNVRQGLPPKRGLVQIEQE